MFKFDKTANKAKIEKLKKDAAKAGFTAEQLTNIEKAPIGMVNSLPSEGVFTDFKIEPKSGNMSGYIKMVADNGDEVSLSSLTRIAYQGDANNISFKPSSLTSKLAGKGVLAGAKNVSPKLNKIVNKLQLTQSELPFFLIGKKFKATEIEAITYYPTDGTEPPTAEELNALPIAQKLAKCSTPTLYRVELIEE